MQINPKCSVSLFCLCINSPIHQFTHNSPTHPPTYLQFHLRFFELLADLADLGALDAASGSGLGAVQTGVGGNMWRGAETAPSSRRLPASRSGGSSP